MKTALEDAIDVLSARIDQPSKPTEWFEITQDRINKFADATMGDQWIHVDPERARNGPFGAPIAHGHLTMSIVLPDGKDMGLPSLEGQKMAIQYGWNKVRFVTPVRVGDLIRMIAMIKTVEPKGQKMIEVINEMTFEIKNSEKPAFVGESVIRIAF